jgi:pectin methylesterase-like acyl-CoA thioesterase
LADTGSGSVDLPRQQLGSAPFALQAEVAASAPWSGLTSVPAGFADGVDNSSAAYDNVIIVAKTGGDFNTIQAALNSIGDASSTNRYLIWVGPGDYNEKISLKPYVDITGAGRKLTKISSTGGASDSAAATVSLTIAGQSNCATSAFRTMAVQRTRRHLHAQRQHRPDDQGCINNRIIVSRFALWHRE